MCNSLENPYPHHGGKLEIPGRGGGGNLLPVFSRYTFKKEYTFHLEFS